MLIENEQKLMNVLSTPSPADVEAAASVDGDLILPGAGGKMGPTLALRRFEIQFTSSPSQIILGRNRNHCLRFARPVWRGRSAGH